MNRKWMLTAMLIGVTALFPRVSAQEGEVFVHERLKKRWETQPVFKVPESVCHDKFRKVLYVSNINGESTEKNGQGFISRLSLKGKIVELKWIEGLNAPKGMAVRTNRLYVSDIDQIVEIDIENFKILNRYDVPGAQFLNDVIIDVPGNVYVSDMLGNKIYRLTKEGQVEVWFESDMLDKPNGLFIEPGHLLIGQKGQVLQVPLAAKQAKVHVDRLDFSIDGLVNDGKSAYLVSDWKGSVYQVSPRREPVKLLDTSSAGINAADIEFIKESNLLIVPTFHDNRVVAYTLSF